MVVLVAYSSPEADSFDDNFTHSALSFIVKALYLDLRRANFVKCTVKASGLHSTRENSRSTRRVMSVVKVAEIQHHTLTARKESLNLGFALEKCKLDFSAWHLDTEFSSFVYASGFH